MIRRWDFRRVREAVGRLKDRRGGTLGFNLMLWFSGVFVSAVIGYFSIPTGTRGEPLVAGWTLTVGALFLAIALASLVATGLCWLWHRDARKQEVTSVNLICAEMDQMEKHFESAVGAKGTGGAANPG